MKQEFRNFKEFYPYYLAEHSEKSTRVLGFIQTILAGGLIAAFILDPPKYVFPSISLVFCFLLLIEKYFIKKTKPFTTKYPWMSFKASLKLYFEILTGKESFSGKNYSSN